MSGRILSEMDERWMRDWVRWLLDAERWLIDREHVQTYRPTQRNPLERSTEPHRTAKSPPNDELDA
jgi:hypothetical protein